MAKTLLKNSEKLEEWRKTQQNSEKQKKYWEFPKNVYKIEKRRKAKKLNKKKLPNSGYHNRWIKN